MAKLVYGPGRRVRRGLLIVVAGGVVLTSVADRLATLDRPLPSTERTKGRSERRDQLRTRLVAAARVVSGVAGVATVTLGATTVATVWARSTTPEVFWRRRLVRDLGNGLVAVTVAALGWDLIYYWNHRFMHDSRFMWAIHVVHHSSERYNLSTALRQPVADAFGVFLPTGALCPAGHPAGGDQHGSCHQPRSINTGSTPSRSTVSVRWSECSTAVAPPGTPRGNPQYIDRNHGSILIVWDRLFGTFEPEGDRPVYGLADGVERYNPAAIIGNEYRDLLRDVARSGSWRARLSHVLRGPGWSPGSTTPETANAPATASLSRAELTYDRPVQDRRVELQAW